MPRKNESPTKQRQHLVSLALSGRFSVTSLCAELGVSRKNAHKWISRYKQHGAAGGLSMLSVWWISPGIQFQFTRPGCHGRMHPTMQAECCRQPSGHIDAQQQRFERWRRCFNQVRTHEGIGMRTRSEVYQCSPRRFDPAIKFDLYVPSTETRRVQTSGLLALGGHNRYVGDSFTGFKVALERDEKTGWVDVRYASVNLGHLTRKASDRLPPTPADGRPRLNPSP